MFFRFAPMSDERRKPQENAAGDDALFLLPRTGTRAKETDGVADILTDDASVELTNLTGNRYNCLSSFSFADRVAPSPCPAIQPRANKE